MSLPARLADPRREARDAELAALLRSAADGDNAAFEAFYDTTIGYAQALARRMLRGPEVEDLLADAFFEAWRNAARFDPGRGSAVTWLLTIVRSRALDRLRQKDPEALEDVPEPADEGADPAERLWQRQAGTRLDAALRTLTAAERWALGLAYFRDLSHAQIAEATGLPLGTVKSSIHRAQGKLRAALAA